MKHLPSALFFVDGIHEKISIAEARVLGIPTFGIIDSNTDPVDIDYPIPANDDSMKTIHLIVNYIADEIVETTGRTEDTDLSIELIEVPSDTVAKSLKEEIEESAELDVKSSEPDLGLSDDAVENADENEEVAVEPQE